MTDLILVKFDDTYGAQKAMNAVRALTEMDYAWVDDVAIVERHRSGRVATHTTHGSVTAGAWFGGLTGMLIGLLFPPAFFALFAVGAGTGAITQKIVKETGLDKEMLDEIKNSLTKGSSALIMIGAHGDTEQMAKAFDKYQPSDVIRREIPEETVDELKAKLEEAERADAEAPEDPASGAADAPPE